MRLSSTLSCLILIACTSFAADKISGAPEPHVLVYTRNQIGPNLYVHENIAASVSAIKKLGAENHFQAEVSDNPGVFSESGLQGYKVIIFDNSNNEIIDTESQKAALQAFVRKGGGIVGIHSAAGGMRQWPWFWSMIGGKFRRHAPMQTFTIKVQDPDHPSTSHLPQTYTWTDEFYFLDHMSENLHVLLVGDLARLQDPEKGDYSGKQFGDWVPLAWCQTFDGGREWYTSLGHKSEHYADPGFTRHLLGGILWAMGETRLPTEAKTQPK